MVLGSSLATRLTDYPEQIVGQTIRIRAIPFEVVGVLAPSGEMGGFYSVDDRAIIPLSTARYRIKVRKVREKRFPELDDELVAAHTDRKTVEELRERVRKEMGHQFASEEEMVIAGVYGGAHTIESLRGYLDYRNHALYSEAEVQGFIDNLVQIGVLVDQAGEWHFAPGSPAAENRFVFTAPEGAAHQPSDFGKLRHPSLR